MLRSRRIARRFARPTRALTLRRTRRDSSAWRRGHGAAAAGSAWRSSASRDQQMVADHQGSRDQGGVNRSSSTMTATGQQRRFRHVRCHVRYFQYRTSIDMVPQCLAIGRGLRSQHTAHNAPAGSDVDSLHSTVGQPAGLVVSARTRLPPLQGTRKRARTGPPSNRTTTPLPP